MEVAFRWPGEPIVQAASVAAGDMPSGDSQEIVTPPAGLSGKEAEEFMKSMKKNKGNRKSEGQGTKERTPEQMQERMQQQGQNPNVVLEPLQRKMTPAAEKINERLSLLMLADIFPSRR